MRSSHLKLILLSFLLFSSCFGGVDNRGSVKNYSRGVVETEGGAFRVGALSPNWRREPFKYKAIFFKNKRDKASISVSSFCKGSFDDAPLHILSNQLAYGMTQEKRVFRKKVDLDGREALRSLTYGQVDGLQTALDSVVLKMNQCVFDFVYITSPAHYKQGVNDFENFYEGFRYLRGPK